VKNSGGLIVNDNLFDLNETQDWLIVYIFCY